ncbi:hypothetical protein DSYM_24810 [Candidatus Desulfobacillus denitrificans]|uniref:Uncharacterized protein n=1 Tax=Candidatus Desulfobacillus denitrificans TaxID=2608985 RepID=A0A809RQ79_9PROT|nr:hypothetical protein DSYM_24810 [Candidatus Desulfobacillus denitrificans]
MARAPTRCRAMSPRKAENAMARLSVQANVSAANVKARRAGRNQKHFFGAGADQVQGYVPPKS